MGILSWLLFGLIVGALAKVVMPGAQNASWIVTIILGIIGALVGGWINSLVGGDGDVSEWSIRGIIFSVLGAVVVLFIYGALTKKR